MILFLIQNLQYYTATLYFIPGLFIPSLSYLVYTCGAALKYTKSPCTYLTRYLGLRQVVNHNNSNTFIQRRSLSGKKWTQLILLLGQSIISNHLKSSFFQVQIKMSSSKGQVISLLQTQNDHVMDQILARSRRSVGHRKPSSFANRQSSSKAQH